MYKLWTRDVLYNTNHVFKEGAETLLQELGWRRDGTGMWVFQKGNDKIYGILCDLPTERSALQIPRHK